MALYFLADKLMVCRLQTLGHLFL